MIRLESVTKRYAGGRLAVDALDLAVEEGEVCVLVGPSGCGKTTTLKMVNRLVEPTSGRILIGGEDVTTIDPVGLRRRIGYVIQQSGLFPHLTVGDNVATVPRLLGWDRARRRRRADELLELVGLDPAEFRDRYPHNLSGGQRQRVGVARALGADPPVLLMDEPFGAVDPVQRQRLQDEFRRLQREVAKTVVLVTHDIDEAVRLGDRIAVMAEGGRLEQYETPEAVLARPASDFVAGFVGADRAVKRLSLVPVSAARLEPLEAMDGGGPAVDLHDTLADALAALLAAGSGRLAVTQDGRRCGTLTLPALMAAASVGDAAGGGAGAQSGGSRQGGGRPDPGGSTRG